MLLVIFGAGASYDSDPARPAVVGPLDRPPTASAFDEDRPPLANQLFDDRPQFNNALEKFPQCAPIVPLVRGVTNIEEVLERLQNEAKEPPPYAQRLRQLAAVRYYFQVMLDVVERRWHTKARGITNYVALLDQILRWGNENVLLVTFNYDRLLEYAVLNLLERPINSIHDYLALGPFSIYKVHGSINWGRVLTNSPTSNNDAWETARALINTAESIQPTSEYVVAQAIPVARDPQHRPLFPARSTCLSLFFCGCPGGISLRRRPGASRAPPP